MLVAIAIAFALGFVTHGNACSHDEHNHMHVSSGGGGVRTAFKYSDVLFTDRFGTNATFAVAKEYRTTQLVWVYTTSKEFIQEAGMNGWGVQASVNAQCKDLNGSSYQVGRIVDVHGHRVTAPWMRGWNPEPYWGCVNDPRYQKIWQNFYGELMDAGVRILQHDDPPMNANAVDWGGCFCEYCNAGFTSYLNSSLTPSELKSLGIDNIASFSYKDWILAGNSTTNIQPYFVTYQNVSVVSHYAQVRSFLDERVGKDKVAITSNNYGGVWYGIYGLFDGGVAELSWEHCGGSVSNNYTCTPADIVPKYQKARALGKQQVLTMEKLGTKVGGSCNASNTLWFTTTTRRLSSLAYAVGGFTITPYDIYEPDNCPRFKGNPELFKDIFLHVRAYPDLFDGFEAASDQQGQGGGDVVHPNTTDVYTYPRSNGTSSVIHVIDWRDSIPTPTNPPPLLTINLTALCKTHRASTITTTILTPQNPPISGPSVNSTTTTTFTFPIKTSLLNPWAMVHLQGCGVSLPPPPWA